MRSSLRMAMIPYLLLRNLRRSRMKAGKRASQRKMYMTSTDTGVQADLPEAVEVLQEADATV